MKNLILETYVKDNTVDITDFFINYGKVLTMESVKKENGLIDVGISLYFKNEAVPIVSFYDIKPEDRKDYSGYFEKILDYVYKSNLKDIDSKSIDAKILIRDIQKNRFAMLRNEETLFSKQPMFPEGNKQIISLEYLK